MESEQSDKFHEFLTQMYIKDSKEQYLRNADLIGSLMVWKDIDNVSADEWRDFWKIVNEKGIKLKTGDTVLKDKQINIFEKFTIEELKDLYSRRSIYVITQYFIDELSKRDYNGHVLVDMNDSYKSFYLLCGKDIAHYRIANKKPRSKKEYERWEREAEGCNYLKMLLDENDVESDIYKFVFFNLQYATKEDMKKIIEFADNGFEIKRKGRKSRDKKIFKYDTKHNLLATYPNRNACIEVEQVSKQSLYNVLSGKRKTLNGYIYEEEK